MGVHMRTKARVWGGECAGAGGHEEAYAGGGINWGRTWACGRAQEQVDTQVHVRSSAPARGCMCAGVHGCMCAGVRGCRGTRVGIRKGRRCSAG